VPWYFAITFSLFLFLLAPFFRKWVDAVLWPKLADWWAGRSRKALLKRVKKLDAEVHAGRPRLGLALLDALEGLSSGAMWLVTALLGTYSEALADLPHLHDPQCTLCWVLLPMTLKIPNGSFYANVVVAVTYIIAFSFFALTSVRAARLMRKVYGWGAYRRHLVEEIQQLQTKLKALNM
jgi:hypothetical protein